MSRGETPTEATRSERERVADLRSDTVTRPTAAMRQAMAEAVVGDDVLGDDPTVKQLEQEAAARFGREAALFVPTGTQGNQIAVGLLTRRGEEIAVGEHSHMYDWEMAALAGVNGVQARILPAARGAIDLAAAEAALHEAGGFRPACRLLVIENTHNFHGGAVVPLSHMERLFEIARSRGASVHIDGARIWNASVASGTPLSAYGALCDTLMVCLSKGLGAPIGSLLISDAERIAEARDMRKRLGGGMRQVGVLAAPARLAMADYEARLTQDHENARALAAGLDALPGVVLDLPAVETNILFVRIPDLDAKAIEASLAAEGVLAIATGSDVLRFVTHGDVDAEDVTRAVAAFERALAAQPA